MRSLSARLMESIVAESDWAVRGRTGFTEVRHQVSIVELAVEQVILAVRESVVEGLEYPPLEDGE